MKHSRMVIFGSKSVMFNGKNLVIFCSWMVKHSNSNKHNITGFYLSLILLCYVLLFFLLFYVLLFLFKNLVKTLHYRLFISYISIIDWNVDIVIMTSRGKHTLCLALNNKADKKEAKSLPKFKDILGKRTVNEEKDVHVSCYIFTNIMYLLWHHLLFFVTNRGQKSI